MRVEQVSSRGIGAGLRSDAALAVGGLHGDRDAPRPLGDEGAGFGRRQLRALGQRLRDLRKTRRWSLKQLAQASNVSIAAIQKIEVGAANTSLLTVFALSEALGEPVDRLVRASQRDSRFTKVVHIAIPQRLTGTLDLTGALAEARMRSRIVALPPNGRRAFTPGPSSGPLFLYVIAGALQITFPDGVTERLGVADAMHLSLREPMTWVNPRRVSSRVLCVADTRKYPDTLGTGELD